MKTLVVAIDGSQASLHGLEIAVPLARAMDLTLELVNVQPPVLLAPAAYAEVIRTIEAAQAQASAEVLKEAAARVEGAVLQTSLVGPPAETIAELSRSERVWGVVVGAKGHSAVGRVLVGSVADRLVHLCSKPVLVVR